MKTYKIYFIYEKLSDLTRTLYAVTDSKERLKEFKDQRRSDMYYIKDHVFKNKKEYLKIMDKCPKLVVTKLQTKSQYDPYVMQNVYVTMSSREETEIILKGEDLVIREMIKYVGEYVTLLKPKIIKSLVELGFYDLLRFSNDIEMYYGVEYAMTEQYDLTMITNRNKFIVDQLELYIALYGLKLKKE